MFVKIQTSIAGHADPRYELDDFSFRPGEEVEVHDDLAAAWIESGVAAPIADPSAKPSRASRKAQE